jgi:hypothetical protein
MGEYDVKLGLLYGVGATYHDIIYRFFTNVDGH